MHLYFVRERVDESFASLFHWTGSVRHFGTDNGFANRGFCEHLSILRTVDFANFAKTFQPHPQTGSLDAQVCRATVGDTPLRGLQGGWLDRQ
jgi:hypothetical protein